MISIPAAARSVAGASASARGSDPKRVSAASHAPTVPGTDTDSGPRTGTASWPRSANAAGVASAGAPPVPFRQWTAPVRASWYRRNMSPPSPHMCG